MATSEHTGIGAQPQPLTTYVTAARRFHLAVALLGLAFVAGIYLDGWAHNHGIVDDSFFTPYHAVMYSAYLLVFGLLAFALWRNVGRGYAWSKALPQGYHLALVGAVLFGLSGVGDMLWHEAFGIEENLEALLSPTHLLLGIGAFLIVTAPLRAAWHDRERGDGFRALLPALIGFAAALAVIAFFTMYLSWATHPIMLISRRFKGDLVNVFGLMSSILPVLFLLGGVLFLLRRWRLPFGALTFVFALNTALTVWLHWEDYSAVPLTALALPAAGFVGDVLLRRSDSRTRLWLFAFVLPFTFTLIYMLTLQVNGVIAYQNGLWWKIHMWLGAPFVSGIGGLLLGLIAFPPPTPSVNDEV